jgi:hypothetical protein
MYERMDARGRALLLALTQDNERLREEMKYRTIRTAWTFPTSLFGATRLDCYLGNNSIFTTHWNLYSIEADVSCSDVQRSHSAEYLKFAKDFRLPDGTDFVCISCDGSRILYEDCKFSITSSNGKLYIPENFDLIRQVFSKCFSVGHFVTVRVIDIIDMPGLVDA